MRKVLAILVLPLMTHIFSGCTSIPVAEARGGCARGDVRDWRLTQAPRKEASVFRDLIYGPDADTELQLFEYSVETWYSLPSGELMICQSAGPLSKAPGGSWAQFGKSNGSWRIISHGCWGCTLTRVVGHERPWASA